MPCIGGIPRQTAVSIPERHLGLFTEADHTLSEDIVAQLADLIEDNVDLDALLRRLDDHHDIYALAEEKALS